MSRPCFVRARSHATPYPPMNAAKAYTGHGASGPKHIAAATMASKAPMVCKNMGAM